MAAHWMLSINYFDLAIKCQLFLELNRVEIERIGRQFKIKDRQILTLNAIFYSFFAINTFLCLYYPKHFAIFATAQVFGMLLAAAVMVYSIHLLKKKIRLLGLGMIRAREKLMSALSIVFAFQITLVFCERIVNILYNNVRYSDGFRHEGCLKDPACMEKACPYLQTQWFMVGSIYVVNLLMVVLVIYISDQFDKPLDKIWRDYLSLVTGLEEHSDSHLSELYHERHLETNSDGYCVIEGSEE